MAQRDHHIEVLTETTQASHNVVKAEKLSVFIGSRCLLADTELKVAEQIQEFEVETPRGGRKVSKSGTVYGLVGPNGCGKSTLLHLIQQKRIPVPANWDTFLVGQHLPHASAAGALQEVLNADAARVQLLKLQEELEEEVQNLADGGADAFTEANNRLLQIRVDLSSWENATQEVTDILVNLGFRAREPERKAAQDLTPTILTPTQNLSGGWRMKVELAKALWLKPKLLLLDEPTNHLDFHALQWLTEKLEQYPHTTIVVSHDVSFLHGVCREILLIRDQKLESLPRDIVSQEDLVQMQRSRPLRFHFNVPEGEDPLAHGLSLHGVEFSYSTGGSSASSKRKQRFHVNGDVRFSGKSRAVLLGRNGSGKSTFLNICVGNLIPHQGTVDRTDGLKIGHYSQLTEDLDNQSELTAAQYLLQECREELAAHTSSTRSTRLRASLAKAQPSEDSGKQKKASANDKRLLEVARGVLSHYGFEGDVAVAVPVDCLSGGQKACLKFAVLSLRPAHILLLDEPTNHLDAQAAKSLAEGLAQFPGGIVTVTHDDLLIYRLIHCNWNSSELIVCQDGSLQRLKNFSAHCLKSLRDEVRRAEEADQAAGRQAHAPGLDETSSTKPEQKATGRKGELPPWLQRRKRNEKPSATTEIATEAALSGSVLEQTMNISCSLASSDAEVYASTCQQQQRAETASAASTRPSSPVCAKTHMYEDAQVLEPCVEKAQFCKVLEPCVEKAQSCKHGRHSRLHKDLKNLNKAVAKWVKKEERGELTRDELIAHVKDSLVAQKLKSLHGEEFDEERFIQDALGRSDKA